MKLKKAKKVRVYSKGVEVVYRCPHCDNDSIFDLEQPSGKTKILCQTCNWHMMLKWKLKV